MKECPNCKGEDFETFVTAEIASVGARDGRLRLNNVRPIVVVGCADCSETIEVIRDMDRVEVTIREES